MCVDPSRRNMINPKVFDIAKCEIFYFYFSIFFSRIQYNSLSNYFESIREAQIPCLGLKKHFVRELYLLPCYDLRENQINQNSINKLLKAIFAVTLLP